MGPPQSNTHPVLHGRLPPLPQLEEDVPPARAGLPRHLQEEQPPVKPICFGNRLQSTLITVKADKGAVIDNRLRSSTVDLQRPRSTLVTAKADKDAVVNDRLRPSTIDLQHPRSTLVTVKADKDAVVNDRWRKGAT